MIRHNTSASNVHRRVRCPGSAAAERGLPETQSEYSDEGTMLHEAFASAPLGQPLPEAAWILEKLGPKQRDLVIHARRLAQDAVDNAKAEFRVSDEEPFEEGYERELWLRKGIKPILPGHCDYWRYYPALKLLIIIDAKFGFAVVDAAPLNLQLRTYALMGAGEWQVANCVVAIVQPRAAMLEDGETLSMAVYAAEDLTVARQELLAARDAWEAPDAPRIASEEACKYCKAQLVCDAFRERLSPVTTLPPGVLPSLADMPEEAFGSLYEGFKLASNKSIADAIKAEARLRIAEGRLPGFRLKENAPRRKIEDGALAINRLLAAEMPPEIVYECATIPVGKVEEALRAHYGYSGPKAKTKANEILGDAITLSTPEPSIVQGESDNRRLL